MKRPTVSLFYDPRNLPKGNFSVRWSVYFDGKQKLFPTGTILSEKDVAFLKANRELSGRVKDEDKRDLWHKFYGTTYFDPITGKELPSLLSKGQTALARIEDFFSFELFSKVVGGAFSPEVQKPYPTDLLVALSDRCKRLDSQEQIGNASLFSSTERSFLRFALHQKMTSEKEPKLPFSLVSPRFLQDYERWMLKEGKAPQPKKDKLGNIIQRKGTPASITMVGIYCRNVRTVFNEAINAKVISQDAYPFKGYVIPQALNKKKALDAKVLSEIYYYPCPPGSAMEFRRDLWIFSYMGNGINFTDMLHLKWKHVDIEEQKIRFIREKTKRTKRSDISEIIIDLNPTTTKILDSWGTDRDKPDEYVFPFLDDSMDAKRKKAVIVSAIKVNNSWMVKIIRALGYDEERINVNTYAARHSFVTTLVRANAPFAFISKKVGHGSFLTTQKYVGSFEDEQTQQYLTALFPKKSDDQ